MAHSYKKHLTNRKVSKEYLKNANRKIIYFDVYDEIPKHKAFRKLSNPYRISDDYYIGWHADRDERYDVGMIIYDISRLYIKTQFNDNPWFRYFRNK